MNSVCPNSIRFGCGSSIWDRSESPLRFETSERPNSREDKPPLTGNQARKDLIESEPPERETREREPGKHRGNRNRKRSDRVGNARPKGNCPEESPRG